MRFRAVMNDPSYMKKFIDILHALASLAKICIFRVCPDKIFFIIMENQQPQAWWELVADQFFSEYAMHGVSDAQNEFYLEFGTEMLSETLITLRRSHSQKSVKIKLTKKIGPCLRFELELPSPMSLIRTCAHDFPVQIIPRNQWDCFRAPEEHTYDVRVEVPEELELHHWLECFKSLGPHCYLVANQDGHFQVKLRNEVATCIKQFGFRTVQYEHVRPLRPDQDRNKMFGVQVDRRKLLAFLGLGKSFPADRFWCDIAERKLAHLHLVREDAILHFFCRHVLEDVAARHKVLEQTAY